MGLSNMIWQHSETFKDVRTNCFFASLLYTHLHKPRHAGVSVLIKWTMIGQTTIAMALPGFKVIPQYCKTQSSETWIWHKISWCYYKDLYGANKVLLLLNEHGDPSLLFPNLSSYNINNQLAKFEKNLSVHVGDPYFSLQKQNEWFYLQLSPHCPKVNKKLMWEVKKVSRFLSMGHRILPSCGSNMCETVVTKGKIVLLRSLTSWLSHLIAPLTQ